MPTERTHPRPFNPRRWWRRLGWVCLCAWLALGLIFLRSAMRPLYATLTPSIRLCAVNGSLRVLVGPQSPQNQPSVRWATPAWTAFGSFRTDSFWRPFREKVGGGVVYGVPIIAPLGLLFALSAWFLWWSRLAIKPGHCGRCGYALPGLKPVDDVGRVICPECALAQLPSGFVPRWATHRRRRIVRAIGAVLLAASLLAALAQHWTREHALEVRISSVWSFQASVGLLSVECAPSSSRGPLFEVRSIPHTCYWWVPGLNSSHEGLIVPCWIVSLALIVPAFVALWSTRPASMGRASDRAPAVASAAALPADSGACP